MHTACRFGHPTPLLVGGAKMLNPDSTYALIYDMINCADFAGNLSLQ
jgi:hypothetical protein